MKRIEMVVVYVTLALILAPQVYCQDGSSETDWNNAVVSAQTSVMESADEVAKEAIQESARKLSSHEEPILECMAEGLEKGPHNPDGVQRVKVTVSESGSIVAERPRVEAEAEFIKHNGQAGRLYVPLAGIPEFLGPNQFHFYFMDPFSRFLLISGHSKSGPSKGTLNARGHTHGGRIILKDIWVGCEMKKRSIYVGW